MSLVPNGIADQRAKQLYDTDDPENVREALRLLSSVPWNKADPGIFNRILQGHGLLSDLHNVKRIAGVILDRGFADQYTMGHLATSFCRASSVRYALRTDGFATESNALFREGVQWVNKCRKAGVAMNTFTFRALIEGCYRRDDTQSMVDLMDWSLELCVSIPSDAYQRLSQLCGRIGTHHVAMTALEKASERGALTTVPSDFLKFAIIAHSSTYANFELINEVIGWKADRGELTSCEVMKLHLVAIPRLFELGFHDEAATFLDSKLRYVAAPTTNVFMRSLAEHCTAERLFHHVRHRRNSSVFAFDHVTPTTIVNGIFANRRYCPSQLRALTFSLLLSLGHLFTTSTVVLIIQKFGLRGMLADRWVWFHMAVALDGGAVRKHLVRAMKTGLYVSRCDAVDFLREGQLMERYMTKADHSAFVEFLEYYRKGQAFDTALELAQHVLNCQPRTSTTYHHAYTLCIHIRSVMYVQNEDMMMRAQLHHRIRADAEDAPFSVESEYWPRLLFSCAFAGVWTLRGKPIRQQLATVWANIQQGDDGCQHASWRQDIRNALELLPADRS